MNRRSNSDQGIKLKLETYLKTHFLLNLGASKSKSIRLGVIGLIMITTGCIGIRTQHFKQTAADRDEILSRFPVVGAWSEPTGGMRCRVLAASSEAVELGSIRVALDVENVGPAAVKFTRAGCPPFSDVFCFDGRRVQGVGSANAYSERVRLEPGQTAVLIATYLGLVPASFGAGDWSPTKSF